MGVLNVPIQINGGASLSEALNLKDRELFVLNNKDLYAFTQNSLGKINSGVSDSTRSLVNNNSSIFNFDVTRNTFTLGYLNFNNSNNTFTSSSNVKFSGVTYLDIPKMVLRNSMYGTMGQLSQLVGEQGQIFFVLQ